MPAISISASYGDVCKACVTSLRTEIPGGSAFAVIVIKAEHAQELSACFKHTKYLRKCSFFILPQHGSIQGNDTVEKVIVIGQVIDTGHAHQRYLVNAALTVGGGNIHTVEVETHIAKLLQQFITARAYIQQFAVLRRFQETPDSRIYLGADIMLSVSVFQCGEVVKHSSPAFDKLLYYFYECFHLLLCTNGYAQPVIYAWFIEIADKYAFFTGILKYLLSGYFGV